ncbi:MAG: nucleotidyltransferase domain-containing protein [Deltaproteobacteria bacterium]|nr:nucleotidyltransferase domain-containing protein [Deltaproteobacteria bacterium]
MRDPWSVLTDHQQSVAKPFLAVREAERKHLVVYLSGAHAYGFPSPDSDLDLKCVHVAPTSQLVGLEVAEDPKDRIEVIDGVELDYGSNELAPVLRGAIKGNGNYLERILGELVLGGDSALLAEAREVVRPLLSRRCARHYAGFATSQLRLFDEKPTAKRALYVLRTAGTGIHLLARGELVIDLDRLRDHLPDEVDELLAIKRTGERSELEAALAAEWRGRLTDVIDAVDRGWRTAVIPAEPPPSAVEAADRWLREVRKRHW